MFAKNYERCFAYISVQDTHSFSNAPVFYIEKLISTIYYKNF